MSRHDGQRLDDIRAAVTAIHDHLERGDLSDGLVFDAVRVRLIEIGEAAKSIDAGLLTAELMALSTAMNWFQDRFAGSPAPDSC